MMAAHLTRIEYTTARRLSHALLTGGVPVTRLTGLGDRNQFEAFGTGFEIQARQFLFRPPSLESCRTSIHPGFALGEQAVDQYRKIAAHGFDRRCEGGQLSAQIAIPGAQVAVALQ